MVEAATAKLLQSCPTLCDPIDGSPPGSPVPGILQARVLEWGAIAFSEITSETSDIFAFTFYGFQKEKKDQPILIIVKTFLYDL